MVETIKKHRFIGSDSKFYDNKLGAFPFKVITSSRLNITFDSYQHSAITRASVPSVDGVARKDFSVKNGGVQPCFGYQNNIPTIDKRLE